MNPSHQHIQDASITGSVRNLSYDKNGNNLSLTRLGRTLDGWKIFDSLNYVYNGNRLKAVDDVMIGQTNLMDFHDAGLKYSQHGKAEYEYDANGNMTFDLNRSLHIQYNLGNNLVRKIIHQQGSIVNHYTLGGVKLGKMFFGRLVIKDGQPTRILHGDGTISLNGSSVEYHYHLKDHLGNVHLVITPDGNNQPVVLQANDYYPFGMVYNMNFQSGGGAHQPNKYLYNSKEEQEMPGKWLDYGWRMYDPQLARFHSVDPMTAEFPFQSPYLYASSNPVRFIDYKGLYTNEPRTKATESNKYDRWGSYIFPNQRGQSRYEILYEDETATVEEPKPQGPVAQSEEVEVDGPQGQGGNTHLLLPNSDVYWVITGFSWLWGGAATLNAPDFRFDAASKAAGKFVGKVTVVLNVSATAAEGYDLVTNWEQAGRGDVAKFGVDATITTVTTILYFTGFGVPVAVILTGVQVANTLGAFDSIYESFNEPLNGGAGSW
jgi:RHS repeat-associated protein